MPNVFGSTSRAGRYYSASFDAKSMIRLLDQETRKMRSPDFYRALERANERAAQVIQAGQADSVRSQIGTHTSYMGRRPQRPGDRLANSLENEANREVYPNTFTVGVESWLNKSPAALYWRVIEEGMEGYTTDALFTDNPGGGRNSYFRPNVGGPHMRMIQGPRGVRIHVSPIQPFHYSAGGRRAFARFDMAQAYIKELGHVGIRNVTKDPKGGIFK